jgi:hypothetical protein
MVNRCIKLTFLEFRTDSCEADRGDAVEFRYGIKTGGAWNALKKKFYMLVAKSVWIVITAEWHPTNRALSKLLEGGIEIY